MKLNEKQLQKVKDYLKNKDVEYIDLHFEVLDHIASDIETKMETSKLDFETAFEKVKEKWNKNFTYKWSFWLGLTNGGSKLFIDHCLRIYKPILIKILLINILFSLAIYSINELGYFNFSKYNSIINHFYTAFALFFIGLCTLWYFKIKNSKIKTSYRYLFNKQVYTNIYTAGYILINSLIPPKDFNIYQVIFFSIALTILITGFELYKKHFKVVSKHKKYQLL
ncbi:hypothetical protein SAMN05444411_101211 [Lutibacter oricola]|uniref:Uncharacterized protein n=1 Tax=Lutibacter oricola TaxID=762486 RepID=A0A1H2RDD5_9FLAO|nr:hypothetical protein [Lutibacter oricola]SDW17452.1 hypothetical protein SAMN05444411_101211 [Lutibacter oricola]